MKDAGTLSDMGMKRAALIIATLTSFMTPFMGSSINLALPSIATEFKMDAVLLSWIASAYLLAAAVSLVPFGRLADILGRKRVFTWGILGFSLFSLFCGLSFSASSLILFRVFQGIGSSMIFATGMAILTSVYPPQERGRVLGLNVAAVYLGLSLGPFLGGVLTRYLTWRSIFLLNVPLGLFIVFLVATRLKGEWAEAKGEKFDLTGSFIYAAAITGIMLGIALLPQWKAVVILLLGFGSMAGFVAWEGHVRHPVFHLDLLRSNRIFAFSGLAALIHYSGTFAVTFLLSLYLQNVRGLSPQAAGLVLVAQPVVMAALSPFAGRLSDRMEPAIVASLGMGISTVGLFLFTFLRPESSLVSIVTCLVVLGAGFALFSSPNTNAIMSSVEKRLYGTASGTVGTMRILGMMLSMGITTLLFTLFIGRVAITPETVPGFMKSLSVAFVVFSALCLAGVFASMVRGNLRSGHGSKGPGNAA